MTLVKDNRQKIALVIGYLLVASFFFALGRYSANPRPPDIRVEEPEVDLTQIYDNLKSDTSQVAGETVKADEAELNCEGKIKGNISSSGKIYHLPRGVFYKRTKPELCFNTEAEAQAAGFRKSKR